MYDIEVTWHDGAVEIFDVGTEKSDADRLIRELSSHYGTAALNFRLVERPVKVGITWYQRIYLSWERPYERWGQELTGGN